MVVVVGRMVAIHTFLYCCCSRGAVTTNLQSPIQIFAKVNNIGKRFMLAIYVFPISVFYGSTTAVSPDGFLWSDVVLLGPAKDGREDVTRRER